MKCKSTYSDVCGHSDGQRNSSPSVSCTSFFQVELQTRRSGVSRGLRRRRWSREYRYVGFLVGRIFIEPRIPDGSRPIQKLKEFAHQKRDFPRLRMHNKWHTSSLQHHHSIFSRIGVVLKMYADVADGVDELRSVAGMV